MFYRNQIIFYIVKILACFFSIRVSLQVCMTKLQMFCMCDLKQRNTAAVASVDEGMLRCVWNELDYHIDICRVTKGSHIQHMYLSHTNLKIYAKKTV
jgi:hypothetical protein